MKKSKSINRLMFWFNDGEDQLYEYTITFGPLAMLLERLINQTYFGKKIKFLNLYFYTQATFDRFELIELNYTHSYGGHVHHNAIFSKEKFDNNSKDEQKKELWGMALDVMLKISNDTKNLELKNSCQKAYNKGIQMKLKEDFISLQETSKYDGKNIIAELCFEFKENNVFARFIIKSNGEEFFNKIIDSTRSDVEFFYEMFKKIIFEPSGFVILKGHYEVEYLPLKIDLKRKI